MELVENPYVSDFTKKTLEQFGWRNNDPIPADLGQLMLQIKDRLPASSRVDVLIDKDAMKEEDVSQIKEMLAAAKGTANKIAQREQLDQDTAGMSDSVRDMYEKLVNTNSAEIIDDRETADPTPAASEPGQPKTTVTEQPVSPADVPAVEEAGISAPMIVMPFCPRCGWDMQQEYDTNVTDKDKEDFLTTLLGGGRFKRDYELAGGKFVIRLRSMLADENFLVQRQLLLDQNDGLILSEAEWFLRMLEYRMACSLEAVYDGNKKPLVIIPELSEIKFEPVKDKPNQTALPAAREFVHSKALAHEVTRRLAATHLRKFQRLVEALEAMTLEPSFWNGIG
jgi:hypothetical protein